MESERMAASMPLLRASAAAASSDSAAEAMVRTVAERQDVARLAGNVELSGVGAVLTFVPVRRTVEQQRAPAGRDGGVADGDVAGGGPGQALHWRGHPQELID